MINIIGPTVFFKAPPRARVREGSAAQEVKEEPEDTLQPRPDEVEMVQTLRRYGVTTPDAVHSLRESGNRVEVALQLALDIAKTREENKAMDEARLESEREKDLAAERQSLEDKALKVLGEVTSHFPKVRGGHLPFWKPFAYVVAGRSGRRVSGSPALVKCGRKRRVYPRANTPCGLSTPPRILPQSLLLNAEDGSMVFRQFVDRLAGDGTCTQAMCVFREKATSLLFLERDAFRHYPESDYQVCAVDPRTVVFGRSRVPPPNIAPDRVRRPKVKNISCGCGLRAGNESPHRRQQVSRCGRQ